MSTYVGVLPAPGWSQWVTDRVGCEVNGQFVPNEYRVPLAGFAITADGDVRPLVTRVDRKRGPVVEVADNWGAHRLQCPEDY